MTHADSTHRSKARPRARPLGYHVPDETEKKHGPTHPIADAPSACPSPHNAHEEPEHDPAPSTPDTPLHHGHTQAQRTQPSPHQPNLELDPRHRGTKA